MARDRKLKRFDWKYSERWNNILTQYCKHVLYILISNYNK